MVATQELFPQSGGLRGKAGKQVLPDGASAHAGLVVRVEGGNCNDDHGRQLGLIN